MYLIFYKDHMKEELHVFWCASEAPFKRGLRSRLEAFTLHVADMERERLKTPSWLWPCSRLLGFGLASRPQAAKFKEEVNLKRFQNKSKYVTWYVEFLSEEGPPCCVSGRMHRHFHSFLSEEEQCKSHDLKGLL